MDSLLPKRPYFGGEISHFSSPCSSHVVMVGSSNMWGTLNVEDQLMEMLLIILSSSIERSLDTLIKSKVSQSNKEQVIKRALQHEGTLMETIYKSTRKLETKHNAKLWALPVDLTMKVRSILRVFLHFCVFSFILNQVNHACVLFM